MATRPSVFPEWATSPTSGDVVEPSAGQKSAGWHIVSGQPQKPPYQTFNWWMQTVSKWIEHNDDLIRWNSTFVEVGESALVPTKIIGSEITLDAAVINIGVTGSNVKLYGALIEMIATETVISDKLITINDGGGATSGDGAGIQVEENNAITAYVKTSTNRNKWSFKAPNNAAVVSIGAEATVVGDIGLVSNVLTFMAAGFSFKNSAGNEIASATDAGAFKFLANSTGHAFGSIATNAGTALGVLAGGSGKVASFYLGCGSTPKYFQIDLADTGVTTFSNAIGTTFVSISAASAWEFPYAGTHIFGNTTTVGTTQLQVKSKTGNLSQVDMYSGTKRYSLVFSDTNSAGYTADSLALYNGSGYVGNVSGAGYWAIGASSPNFAIKKLTGTLASAASTDVAHGLGSDNVIKCVWGKYTYNTFGYTFGQNSTANSTPYIGGVSDTNITLLSASATFYGVPFEIYIIYEAS